MDPALRSGSARFHCKNRSKFRPPKKRLHRTVLGASLLSKQERNQRWLPGAGEGENRRAAQRGTDSENAACGSRATAGAPAKPDSLRRQIADKSQTNRRQIADKSQTNRRQIADKSQTNRRQIADKSQTNRIGRPPKANWVGVGFGLDSSWVLCRVRDWLGLDRTRPALPLARSGIRSKFEAPKTPPSHGLTGFVAIKKEASGWALARRQAVRAALWSFAGGLRPASQPL